MPSPGQSVARALRQFGREADAAPLQHADGQRHDRRAGADDAALRRDAHARARPVDGLDGRRQPDVETLGSALDQRAVTLPHDEILARPQPRVIERRDALGLVAQRHAREGHGRLRHVGLRPAHALQDRHVGHGAVVAVEQLLHDSKAAAPLVPVGGRAEVDEPHAARQRRGIERFEAEAFGQFRERIGFGPMDVERARVPRIAQRAVGEDPPADAPARLEHDGLLAEPPKLLARGNARRARPDDDDVHIEYVLGPQDVRERRGGGQSERRAAARDHAIHVASRCNAT